MSHTYIVSLLGQVSAYGIRADEACQVLIEKTIDACARVMSDTTGLSMDALLDHKESIRRDVVSSTTPPCPRPCQGRNQYGRPCKKMTYHGWCSDHQDQAQRYHQKRCRVSGGGMALDQIDMNALRIMRFPFMMRQDTTNHLSIDLAQGHAPQDQCTRKDHALENGIVNHVHGSHNGMDE